MAGEARVNLCDQIHGGSYPLAVGRPRVQCPFAEVFVNMPHALAMPLGGGAEQSGTAFGQSDRGQPMLRDQSIALGDRWIQALDDDRTRAAAGHSQAHPIYARAKFLL